METNIMQSFITSVLPFVAIVVSVWFAVSAKKDSDKAQFLLEQTNKAIEGWQSQIMESTKSILDTTPQVIAGKTKLAKIEAAKALIETIQTSIAHTTTNPQGGASGHTQTENLKELNSQLSKILDTMN